MDFINEKELYDKTVAPAIAALTKSLEEVMERLRADLDGAALELTVPEIKLTFKLKIPKET